jgi:hypothetical protein
MRLSYDRRTPDHVVDEFEHGCLSPLIALGRSDRWTWDVYFRRKAGSTLERGRCALTVYAGLTSVLTVVRDRDGWSATTHATYATSDRTSWSSQWGLTRPLSEFCEFVPDLVDFVLDATEVAQSSGQHTKSEGRVHAAFANGVDHDRAHLEGLRIVDREASVGFASKPDSQQWMSDTTARLAAALADTVSDEAWWPPRLPRGTGCDFVCTDGSALYAVEAKPATAGAGITAGPMQVRVYAELFADWIASQPEHAAIIETMVEQRHRIGFGRSAPPVVSALPVVPVLLVGDGDVPTDARRRAELVAGSISGVSSAGVAALQWWRVDAAGRVTAWH